jgi:hypothetical protein
MDGKLGIDTATSVAYNPNAYNGTNANIRLTNGSAGVNRYTGIAFGGGGATEAFIGSVQNSGELAEIVFQTYNGSAYGERARITSGGNVLIGTTTDSGFKLDVNGTSRFTSAITVDSRLALQPSYFGYSSSYKTLLIGSAGTDYITNAVSLAFNVDVTGNPSGAFNGSGQEYIWRNAGVFIGVFCWEPLLPSKTH